MADDGYNLDSSPFKSDGDDLILDSPAPAKSSNAPAERPISPHSAAEAREKSLKAELASLRKINGVVEDVISSLEKAKANMNTVNQTTLNATTLLNTWTRILSQTEHNQRLLLNPAFQGATQDVADAESDAAARQAAIERAQAVDAARREAAARKAEDDERRREAAAAAANAPRGRLGSRGRASGSRPASGLSRSASTSSNYVGVGGQGGRGGTAGRTTRGSGIGRGTRGRGRG